MLFSIACGSFTNAFAAEPNTYLYYDRLSDNQKAVYNAAKENPFAYNVSGSRPYPNGYTVTLETPLEYTEYYSGATDESDSDALEIIGAGLYAFAYDNPEYFWFDGFAQNTICSSVLQEDGRTYKTTVTGYNVYPLCKASAFSSKQDLIDKTEEMMSIVNSVKITGTSRYEKLKSIHDAVCTLTA